VTAKGFKFEWRSGGEARDRSFQQLLDQMQNMCGLSAPSHIDQKTTYFLNLYLKWELIAEGSLSSA